MRVPLSSNMYHYFYINKGMLFEFSYIDPIYNVPIKLRVDTFLLVSNFCFNEKL